MNVIVSNKNQLLLENFFYQRMILDITAIKDYTNIVNLQKLSMSLDMEKVILLLDGTDATSNPSFLSNLVSMGIYNFTKNIEGIQYLYNTPNTYRDVAQFHKLNSSNLNNVTNINTVNTNNSFISPAVLDSPSEKNDTRIIGIKNITKQSGATSLAYMMKNELSKNYKVIAIEVDKTDFSYFRDKSMVSTITSDVGTTINKYRNYDVIVVDINNSLVAEGYCQEVLYLIEPSIIKLQKLMVLNATALVGLKNKKIILNQNHP